ncbi:MAG: hypothetical protein ACRD1K_18285 [Acidimicrobiales bacterium]
MFDGFRQVRTAMAGAHGGYDPSLGTATMALRAILDGSAIFGPPGPTASRLGRTGQRHARRWC